MHPGCRSALSAVGTAAAIALAFATVLEISVAAGPATAKNDVVMLVDRTNKSDRAAFNVNRISPLETREPDLPEGCLSASAWQKTTIYTNEIAGRCVV